MKFFIFILQILFGAAYDGILFPPSFHGIPLIRPNTTVINDSSLKMTSRRVVKALIPASIITTSLVIRHNRNAERKRIEKQMKKYNKNVNPYRVIIL